MKQLIVFITFLSLVAFSCTPESSTPKLGIIYPESDSKKMPLVYTADNIGSLVIQDLNKNPHAWAYKSDNSILGGTPIEEFENFEGIIVTRYFDEAFKEDITVVSYNSVLVYSFKSNSQERTNLDSALSRVIISFNRERDSVALEYENMKKRVEKESQLKVLELLKNKGT